MIGYTLKDDYSEDAHPQIIHRSLHKPFAKDVCGNDFFSNKAKKISENKGL